MWGIEKLRAYVATVKSRFRPTISHDASILLERHYSLCRSSPDIAIQITVRFLESLIRLSQAHASLMHRNVVEVDDAVAIILLMESSVASTTHNSNNSLCGDPTSSFPEDNQADLEFLLMKSKVLEKYDMLYCLSPIECALLEKEQQKQSICDVNMASWENFQCDYMNVKPVVATPGGQQRIMDHYGRFTQTTTPSPSEAFGNQHEFNHDVHGDDDPSNSEWKRPRISSSRDKRHNNNSAD